MNPGTQARPGWDPDPWRQAKERWWDGYQWTPSVQGPTTPVQSRTAIGFGLVALALIGAGLAVFTNVSLLTGTGTVWTGVAIAAIATVGAFVVRPMSWSFRIICALLTVLAVSSAIYDEVQLQHKRDEISRIVG